MMKVFVVVGAEFTERAVPPLSGCLHAPWERCPGRSRGPEAAAGVPRVSPRSWQQGVSAGTVAPVLRAAVTCVNRSGLAGSPRLFVLGPRRLCHCPSPGSSCSLPPSPAFFPLPLSPSLLPLPSGILPPAGKRATHWGPRGRGVLSGSRKQPLFRQEEPQALGGSAGPWRQS